MIFLNAEELLKYYALTHITVVDAMQLIDNNAKGILFLVDENRKLIGVITDGDIRRWLIKTGDLHANVEQFMNRNPKSIVKKDLGTAKEYMSKLSITALPIVTNDGILNDVIFHDETDTQYREHLDTTLKEVKVVVMAGGKGTRLYPYTKILPKPLIPIGDIPIMERILDAFREYGIKSFYATVNYKKNMIKSYFSEISKDYEITYVEEDKPLGTGGSLRLIDEKLDEPFIVTNCDILIDANYGKLYRHHIESDNEITVVCALKNLVVPYGVVDTSENGLISAMKEKPKLSYLVNTGMYVLNPELVKEIPENEFYHMTDLINKLLKEKRKVGMYPVSEDAFLDMGEFEEMNRMEEKLRLHT